MVIEIDYPGGRSLAQSTESSVADACVHQLASALASTQPGAEPLSG